MLKYRFKYGTSTPSVQTVFILDNENEMLRMRSTFEKYFTQRCEKTGFSETQKVYRPC